MLRSVKFQRLEFIIYYLGLTFQLDFACFSADKLISPSASA